MFGFLFAQLLNGRFVHILVVEDLMAELIDPNCKEYHQTCEAYVLLARSFVIVEKISFHFCFFFPLICATALENLGLNV